MAEAGCCCETEGQQREPLQLSNLLRGERCRGAVQGRGVARSQGCIYTHALHHCAVEGDLPMPLQKHLGTYCVRHLLQQYVRQVHPQTEDEVEHTLAADGWFPPMML